VMTGSALTCPSVRAHVTSRTCSHGTRCHRLSGRADSGHGALSATRSGQPNTVAAGHLTCREAYDRRASGDVRRRVPVSADGDTVRRPERYLLTVSHIGVGRVVQVIGRSVDEGAELVAVGVGVDAPGDLLVLRTQQPGARVHEQLDVGGSDVDVDAVLYGLGLGNRNEDQ